RRAGLRPRPPPPSDPVAARAVPGAADRPAAGPAQAALLPPRPADPDPAPARDDAAHGRCDRRLRTPSRADGAACRRRGRTPSPPSPRPRTPRTPPGAGASRTARTPVPATQRGDAPLGRRHL